MKSIIHIGGNKTASTLFQRRLFSKHPKIGYMGEDCENYADINKYIQILVHEDESVYNENISLEIINSIKNNKEIFIFSNEDIMGTRHPSVCARRLKKILPDAQVIMVMRNQRTTWASWYVNHGAFLKLVPKDYWKKYVSFKEWLSYSFSFPYITPLEAMNYERYYNIFKNSFGEKNVHVFLYEDFIHNAEYFYSQWGGVLNMSNSEIKSYLDGFRERTSITSFQFKIHQISKTSVILSKVLNIIFRNFLDNEVSAKVNIPVEFEDKISNYYASGNTKLETTLGLELKKYDYPLESK
ncbi:hypothetical protein SMGD1_0497 [Sulfurimonas gotlandica GD1]|uniref:Sulfotransferase domain-containing protein n=1 Tax=Sulfurimonas gotlandica (strain DSM 19862 / JCM 16533 / GD1) TaxID=929558 RepID=B6BKG9_SULGG|nr:hypothetical protein [Sulfurimonas gotlandica]EDZ62236.1 hypothetical protein CBGD1_151 [Sulfurimonas gotlandica GD1]EHP29024.1 hypothetical protein SMGD1_0497 [Sulfurimonas gotlandica GD1]